MTRSGTSAADTEGRKAFSDGTHRVVAPSVTLARVLPLSRQFGLTRIAVLTGLDTIGIPVVAAVRPNSRSVAVHQGKGATLDAAKASAVMEALECWHAETMSYPLRLACHAEIVDDAVDPARLPRADRADLRLEKILWVEGRDLVGGRELFVPHELVSADFTAPLPPGAGHFQATTNGLASGNHILEAITHGLYEVIERDATTQWHLSSTQMQASRLLDLATVDANRSKALLARLIAAQVDVRIWDVTSDIGIPTFLVLLDDASGPEGIQPELGAGSHPDRDVALSRALTEAAQARLTTISGARDDLASDEYDMPAKVHRHELAACWRGVAPARAFHQVSTSAKPTLREDLDDTLARLARAGLTQVVVVDLTRTDIAIPVARVIVPGLEGPWMPPGGEYLPGRRALRG